MNAIFYSGVLDLRILVCIYVLSFHMICRLWDLRLVAIHKLVCV